MRVRARGQDRHGGYATDCAGYATDCGGSSARAFGFGAYAVAALLSAAETRAPG